MCKQQRRESAVPVSVVLVMIMLGTTFAAESWVGRIQAPQYFAVSVEDVDGSVDWYCKAFGLRKLDDSRAEDGKWRIVNLANDDLFVEIIRDNRDSAADRARGFAKVGFGVPDVNAVADRAKVIFGSRPKVLEFPEHGIRILQLRDPEGNIVQLSSTLDERGERPE